MNNEERMHKLSMRSLKVNQRVTLPNHDFLSNGYILRILPDDGITFYVIKLDVKAPNTYAWETDEVLMLQEDIKLEKKDD